MVRDAIEFLSHESAGLPGRAAYAARRFSLFAFFFLFFLSILVYFYLRVSSWLRAIFRP